MVNELMPVLFVAVVEAYLKDVLMFAAGVDESLMESTDQTVSYKKALNARSLEDLIFEFRSKWARKFIGRGGLARWIKDLKAMGARGYRSDTADQMETLWGVRFSPAPPSPTSSPEVAASRFRELAKISRSLI